MFPFKFRKVKEIMITKSLEMEINRIKGQSNQVKIKILFKFPS
jgi:hypothetical protein